jgi:crotonobetainyl-CoA:carnitine CoA-transferase CaiB-like acyl-CoA transferase
MTVDVTRQKGMEIFKRLIKKCDVFLENNSPQTMEKLGITYQMLRDEKPDIIYVRMPAFGLSGPYRDFRAYGSHIEAFSGHSMLRGYLDMDPTSSSLVVASDASAPVHAAFAVISALLYRDRTGNGQLVELAQVESFIPFLAYQLTDYAMNRRVQSTSGNRFPGAAPSGCYRCKGEDKWVMIVCHNDKEWEGFCRALGNPLWTKDKKFADALSRYKNQDELNKLIQQWTIQNDSFKIFHLLQKEGVPAAPVEDYRDAYNDPHLKARGFFEQITQADCGTHFYPGVPWKFSKTPLSIHLPPCRLGEHNEYIYKRIIGVSDDEYTELQKEGHVGMDFIPEIP